MLRSLHHQRPGAWQHHSEVASNQGPMKIFILNEFGVRVGPSLRNVGPSLRENSRVVAVDTRLHDARIQYLATAVGAVLP